MNKIPESLRRILDAQQKPAFKIPERKGDVTTIWRDGEVVRESKGRARSMPGVPPIQP